MLGLCVGVALAGVSALGGRSAGSEFVLVTLAVSAFGVLGAATCMAGARCGICGDYVSRGGWQLGSWAKAIQGRRWIR